MVEKKELTCIGCPMGCQMEVELEDGAVKKIVGFACRKGEAYAAKEVVDPRRIVTTVLPVDGGEIGMVPVKTASDIPKSLIRACMDALRSLRVTAPVAAGQVIVENLCGTGVDVVATRAVTRRT